MVGIFDCFIRNNKKPSAKTEVKTGNDLGRIKFGAKNKNIKYKIPVDKYFLIIEKNSSIEVLRGIPNNRLSKYEIR